MAKQEFTTAAIKIQDRLVIVIPDAVASDLQLSEREEVHVTLEKPQQAESIQPGGHSEFIPEETRKFIDQYLIPNSNRKADAASELRKLIKQDPKIGTYIIWKAVQYMRNCTDWDTVHKVAALLFDPFQTNNSARLKDIPELKRAVAEKIVQFGIPDAVYSRDYGHVKYVFGIVGVDWRLDYTTKRFAKEEAEEEKERILKQLLG